MHSNFHKLAILAVLLLSACSGSGVNPNGSPELSFSGETHVRNLRQMTLGGINGKASWSSDGKSLTFQHYGKGLPGFVQANRNSEPECDQIFAMKANGSDLRGISSGKGKATSSSFLPKDRRILFSSTESGGEQCPAEPDRSHGYVWPLYDTYKMYTTNTEGEGIQAFEPGAPKSYNAEATVCEDRVVFTSTRDGDLDLYTAKIDPSFSTIEKVKRLTQTLGYDGEAAFSPDCKMITWAASRPSKRESAQYQADLRNGVFRPGKTEIWVANADGSNAHAITRLGVTSFAPTFAPDGKKVVFSTNFRSSKSHSFELYMIDIQGTRLQAVTRSDAFNSFPEFSPNGKYLLFSSSRRASEPNETNLFIADWDLGRGRNLMPDDVDPADRFYASVEKLSAPEMEGRGVTTYGLARSEDFVAEQFDKIGLKPYLGGDFKKDVQVQTGMSADPKKTHFEIVGAKKGTPALAIQSDFMPAPFSSNEPFSGKVVDVGYGIVAPEFGVDDYRNIQGKGRIALIKRHTPPQLKLSPAQEDAYGDLRFKTFLAREKGFKAVLFYEADARIDEAIRDSSKTLREPARPAGIPVLIVKRLIAKDLAGKTVHGEVAQEREIKTVHNLVGSLGTGCGTNGSRPVVVGAHLDHLGFGSENSLEPYKKGLHPGADDNASGVAALFDVARNIARQKDLLHRGCFVFAAFTGEEIGVVGSSQFVDWLRQRKIHPKAMLNMDMVGRMTQNTVMTFGTESAAEWSGLVNPICEKMELTCKGGGDGYGPSDHMPFYIDEVPVLHFFTGAHGDYHRTTDTADKINATGGAEVAELVSQIAAEAAKGGTHLTYRKAKATAAMGPLNGTGDRKSFGAYLGTIPDYASINNPMGSAGKEAAQSGVKLAGVRPGGPADAAGIKGGDTLVGIDNRKVGSLEDYTYILQGLMPGQRVLLKVKRQGMDLDLVATVGKRE